VKLPGGKKALWLAIGIIILVFLAHRLSWHHPRAPVVRIKNLEVQDKVQPKMPVTVLNRLEGEKSGGALPC
jgi:aspartate carbamoyltransferase regulatory subunit